MLLSLNNKRINRSIILESIEEMDINPFIVGEAGNLPVVADARMIISGVE